MVAMQFRQHTPAAILCRAINTEATIAARNGCKFRYLAQGLLESVIFAFKAMRTHGYPTAKQAADECVLQDRAFYKKLNAEWDYPDDWADILERLIDLAVCLTESGDGIILTKEQHAEHQKRLDLFVSSLEDRV